MLVANSYDLMTAQILNSSLVSLLPSFSSSRKFCLLLTFAVETGVPIGSNKRQNRIHKTSATPRPSRIRLAEHGARKGTIQILPVSQLCNFSRPFRVSAAGWEVSCKCKWGAERKRDLRPIGCLESHKLTFNPYGDLN